jgi:4-hydroxy-4-methyl-2-oxoglutarate aldolase
VSVVVRNIRRVDPAVTAGYGKIGVATVHEAQGRIGLLANHLRPIYRPAHMVGPAVTCQVAPGDNWMIHVAVEVCQPGDVLVVTPTSPCEDGYFGELLATSLASRGVKGLIIEAGCRDTAELTEMKFPVWSKAVCAQGTVKETTANVNMPVVCGRQLIHPGDLIVADDDGVVCVRRKDAKDVLDKSIAREEKEAKSRKRYIDGEMGLDMYGWRERLAQKGLTYIDEMPEE